MCSQICNKKGEKYECSCKDGFKILKDGKTCTEKHPCEKEDNGGCQHKCNTNGTSFSCSCRKGFNLDEDGKACEKGMWHSLIDSVVSI